MDIMSKLWLTNSASYFGSQTSFFSLCRIVKLLISWNFRVVDVQDNWGHTPLTCAAISSQEMVIQLLLPRWRRYYTYTNCFILLNVAQFIHIRSSLRKSISALEQSREVVSKLFTACSDSQMKQELISAVLQCDVNFIQVVYWKVILVRKYWQTYTIPLSRIDIVCITFW